MDQTLGGDGGDLGRLSNLLAAYASIVDDRVDAAVRDVVGRSGGGPAAVAALYTFMDGASIDELRKVLGIEHSSTVRLVDRLVDDGLVTRETGASGRAVVCRLTGRGRRAAQRILAARLAAAGGDLSALTVTEARALTNLLEKLLVAATPTAASGRHHCRLCDLERCGYPEHCPIMRSMWPLDRGRRGAHNQIANP